MSTKTPTSQELLVVFWEWDEKSKHAGGKFLALHALENDGRMDDWKILGLRPLGAARVVVTEGSGLELLPHSTSEGV